MNVMRNCKQLVGIRLKNVTNWGVSEGIGRVDLLSGAQEFFMLFLGKCNMSHTLLVSLPWPNKYL